jgi:hypothetical protein
LRPGNIRFGYSKRPRKDQPEKSIDILMGDGVFSQRKWNSSMTLTGATLIDRIYNSTDLPKVTSTKLVDPLLEISKRILEKGEDILVFGFGN